MKDYSCSPVLLIYDTNERYDYETVQQWFQDSRFNWCEASNVFEAIEELSDFTMQHHPDVILLKVSSKSKEDRMIRRVACDSGFSDFEVPIAVLSDTPGSDEKCPYAFGNLKQLKAQLDRASKAAAASN
jgi:hypothetical protein